MGLSEPPRDSRRLHFLRGLQLRKRYRSFHRRSASGRSGGYLNTKGNTNRRGRRSVRSRTRAAARPRRCANGCARRSATKGNGPVCPVRSVSGSRNWSGKTASGSGPTRCSAKPRLFSPLDGRLHLPSLHFITARMERLQPEIRTLLRPSPRSLMEYADRTLDRRPRSRRQGKSRVVRSRSDLSCHHVVMA